MFQKLFHLKENGTDVKTEVIGGITTFMAMAYILAVNPSILSQSGMDSQAVLIATALAAFVGTLCMAFMANYPFALAPGLGLNAYFAYTVCGTLGACFAGSICRRTCFPGPISDQCPGGYFQCHSHAVKKGCVRGYRSVYRLPWSAKRPYRCEQ